MFGNRGALYLNLKASFFSGRLAEELRPKRQGPCLTLFSERTNTETSLPAVPYRNLHHMTVSDGPWTGTGILSTTHLLDGFGAHRTPKSLPGGSLISDRASHAFFAWEPVRTVLRSVIGLKTQSVSVCLSPVHPTVIVGCPDGLLHDFRQKLAPICVPLTRILFDQRLRNRERSVSKSASYRHGTSWSCTAEEKGCRKSRHREQPQHPTLNVATNALCSECCSTD